MKVLVVKLSAMGDILHAMPAVRRVIEEGHETAWAVDARYGAVLDLFPGLSRVHVIDPKEWGRAARRGRIAPAVRGLAGAIDSLRRADYDVALDLQGLVKSGIVARFSRPRRIVGFEMKACREKAAALFYWEKIPVDLSLPVEEQNLRTAASALGFAPKDADAGLVVPERAHAAAKEILKGTSPCVFVVGAGWPTKVLPGGSFRRIAVTLSMDGPIIALSGSDGERERAEEILKGLPSAIVLDRLPLPVLAGLLRMSRVVVGGDTGLVHLAAMLGTPTVSFYGASLGSRSGPRGGRNLWVQSELECSPCYKRRCSDIVCMERMDTEKIVQKVREVCS